MVRLIIMIMTVVICWCMYTKSCAPTYKPKMESSPIQRMDPRKFYISRTLVHPGPLIPAIKKKTGVCLISSLISLFILDYICLDYMIKSYGATTSDTTETVTFGIKKEVDWTWLTNGYVYVPIIGIWIFVLKKCCADCYTEAEPPEDIEEHEPDIDLRRF